MAATHDIRAVRPEDASGIAAIYAPYVTETPISFELVAPTTAEIQRRIEEHPAPHPWLVCERDGEVLGYAYASPHRAREAYRWSVDVSAYVRKGATRQGIGRSLYEALIPRLRELGFANAFAGIALPNAASVALHEGAGFAHLGTYRRVGYKLGAWHDVGWWQLMLAAGDHGPRM